MQYAVIKNSKVINVIEWNGIDPYHNPEGNLLVQNDTVGIGWEYNETTGEFTNPFDVETPEDIASYRLADPEEN